MRFDFVPALIHTYVYAQNEDLEQLLGLFSEGVGRRLHGLELSYEGGSLFKARNAL